MVVPIDPFERGELDLVDRLPRSSAVDQLGLVESDRRLREGVVIAVAHGSNRGVGAGVDKALSEGKGGELAARIRVQHEPLADRLAVVVACPQRHLQGVEHEARLHRGVRSEERRVGKECRSWWVTMYEKE